MDTVDAIIAGTFLTVTLVSFVWALWMGYRGIRADHTAWLSFGHAPGAPGTFDAHYRAPRDSHAA